MEGYGKELFRFITTQAIEATASAGLNQLNNADPDSGAGVLMSVLGGKTTDEQLANISSQITVAQGMITSLQANLVNFESQNHNMLQALKTGQDEQNFTAAMGTMITDYGLLQNALVNYTNAVSHCYSNGVIKTQLNATDQGFVTTLLSSGYGESGNQDLASFANTVLTDIQAATSPSFGPTVYDYGMTVFRDQVPFEHQTYTNMYNLFNYITGMRAAALFLMKEYNSYQWSTNVPATSTLAQWMTNSSSCSFFAGAHNITQVANQIDNDVANNSTLLKIATLLSTSSVTDSTQRLAYLQGLITTNYPFTTNFFFSGPTNQPVYQVINNGDQQNYLLTWGGPISFTVIQVINYNAVSARGNTTNYYSIANYAQHTADGRFQLASTNDLSSLLTSTTVAPLPYLRSDNYGDLPNININTRYIYLNSPAITNTSYDGSTLSNTLTGAGPANASLSQSAVLINANAYTASDPQYVTGTSVLAGAAESNLLFMCIYYDTHLATGTNQYYAPSGGWTELGPLVSLASGDVLDLSGLSGPQTPNATVRISGNATIIGGGAGTTAISGLTIETYGGNLTLSNLCVTANNGPLINNVSGPLTVVVLGSNSLATTVGPAVVSTSGANITFTGPGSLAVTTTDNQAPAVQATGDIIVTGATNLTFISSGSTSLAATRIFIYNSTVTSKVVWETDNEFAAGTIALGNSVLDMSYGIINPYIISPCTWLGHIRNTSHFTVQQTHSLDFGQGIFEDGVYVQLAGTTGTSKFNNINLISQDAYYDDVSVLQHNGTVNFTMSYSITNNGTNYFQGLGKLQSIQIYKEDDVLYTWDFESADITSNVMGDVASTYHVAGNDTWINTTNIYPFPSVTENTNPFGYTINPDNKTVTITGFTGAGALIIPSSMHGYPVTGIAANAFWANTTLTSVTIPGSVTSIYDQAFLDCCGLTAVYFQGNAPSLGANVFAYVNATAHSLPGTTGWGATYGCLTTALWVPFTCTTNSDNATVTLTGYTGLGGAVIIPNLINGLPVTGIAANAFQTNTALTSITIPASVTSIPDQAFENCYCLTAVYFQGSAPSLGANVFTGADLATVYYLPVPGTTGWDATFGGLPTALWEPFASTTNSDNATVTLTGYTGPGGTVTIPGTLNGLSVTSIGANAFTTNLLVSALQITNVLIPNTVTNLGDGAFQRCSNLVGVYFQGNAPSLGANVFAGDALATAYSLPATTGWGAMFGVLRTAPWLTVNGGTNGGDYSNLQQVTITANNPTPTNGLMAPLVQWTGTTQ